MGLARYNQKRDFKKTREPEGIAKKSSGELRFVIQKHAASHLHYDFRLEIDGVLVSWAVPKGPSANPADRRLAMHVEDHPMDYMTFEGTIPKGEYGGGTVMVWDIGTYRPEAADGPVSKDNALMKKQLKDESIKIIMEGKKVKGAWHLFKMKENQWLLTKAKDEFSGAKVTFDEASVLTQRDFAAIEKGEAVWHSNRKTTKKELKKDLSGERDDEGFTADDVADARKLASFPRDWRPEKATLTDAAFDHDDWIFETKFDGYRALVQVEAGKPNLVSRNGLSFDKKYPELVSAFDGIRNDMVIDGEIVVEDEKGKSRFQWLQHFGEKPKGQLRFYAFDILYFNGFDLRGLELMKRKKILRAALPETDSVKISGYIEKNGVEAFSHAQKMGGEGIIAKKKTSPYAENKRSKDWLKIKAENQQEMVIGGFTDPSGSRSGLGALLCGFYDKDKKLVYANKVGSGFTDDILAALHKKLLRLERKTPPFENPPREKGIHWVTPELVAQLKFSEWTETGSMRHPVYLGLREDKKASDVVREMPEDILPEEAQTEKKAVKPKSKSSGKVEISNRGKIFWPKEKITKGDVIDYYDAVSDYILPYLKDRPQSLRRTPNGIKDQGFFQKNVEGMVPDWVKTRKIHSESNDESITYMLCQDKDTLLYMANLGCIEINPWSSRVGSINHPDYIIFDLDPQDVPTQKIVTVLMKVKEVLDAIKVPAYVKTSGGKGIHVFIPVKPKYTYDQTRTFSHIVSQMVERELPEIVSLERMPAKRKNKVYLDFLQNGKGKTMASVYSLRPREGATASTPLSWDEIDGSLDLKDYTIRSVPKRLEKLGDLWQDFFGDAIDLKSVLKNLSE